MRRTRFLCRVCTSLFYVICRPHRAVISLRPVGSKLALVQEVACHFATLVNERVFFPRKISAFAGSPHPHRRRIRAAVPLSGCESGKYFSLRSRQESRSQPRIASNRQVVPCGACPMGAGMKSAVCGSCGIWRPCMHIMKRQGRPGPLRVVCRLQAAARGCSVVRGLGVCADKEEVRPCYCRLPWCRLSVVAAARGLWLWGPWWPLWRLWPSLAALLSRKCISQTCRRIVAAWAYIRRNLWTP